MPLTIEVADIFKDAYDLHAQSLKMLGEGDIRDAAEKAWCATKRATDALILARTGEEPITTAATSDGLDLLVSRDPRGTDSLQGRYYSRIHSTSRSECFYNGRCSSPDHVRRIRETIDFIKDAENLADE